jgi:phosphoribosyl-ATP pyrophosphohydrolase
VLYHLLVVLKARDIKLAEVETVLGARASQSGFAEKASRKGG